MSADIAVDGTCHYYLTKKRRYCRFQPKDGQQYCPEHSCIMGIYDKRKRIPCPLNPNHNCYEDDLQKHVKKCNVTKIQRVTQESSYYVQGINKGPRGTKPADSPQENKKICVKDLTSSDLAAMIEKVNKLYQDLVEKVETVVLEHPCVREEYCGSADGDLAKALGERAALRKELLQQASLVGQLGELGFLTGNHCFVEMGAGKGKLSHWIQKASKNSNNSFLLIERSSVRYKMDSFHKQGGAESEFKRIKIDIEDLCLGNVELVNSSNSVVVVGKHLCGGATDMGITCAVETLWTQNVTQNSSLDKSSNRDLSLPTADSATLQQSTHKQTLGSDANLSEIIPSQPVEISGDVLNNSLTISESLAEVNQSPSVDMSPAVSRTDHQHTPSDKVLDSHALDSITDNDKQQQTAGDYRTICNHHDTSPLCNQINYCTEKSAQVLNKDRSISIHNDAIMDAKRKECNSPGCGTEQTPPAKTPRLENSESKRLPQGIMVALCCHHVCTWDTYLGQEFMLSHGVSPQEFDLLTRLSSWATCAKVTAKSTRNRNNKEDLSVPRKSDENDKKKIALEDKDDIGDEEINTVTRDHEADDLVNLEASKTLREQLSVPEREDIGWKCKRLIDTGRLHFLRSKGMNCFLRRYISEEFTPENVVLIAHLPRS